MTDATPRRPDPLARVLEDRLSSERLRPYRAAVGGDLDLAIGLYEWNSATAGAFFETLGHFEVLLRNALHDQLSAWHTAAGRPGHWYEDPAAVLDARRHADVASARDRIRRERQTETPGKVVAELNFGFWRFLLDRRYQTMLWAPALRRAFPHLQPQRRDLVYSPVYELNRLRNRIAHHEPIHARNLSDRHDDLLRVTGFIDPAAQAWLSSLSRVPAVLRSRPR